MMQRLLVLDWKLWIQNSSNMKNKGNNSLSFPEKQQNIFDFLSLISLTIAHFRNSKAAVFFAERLGSLNLWVWPSFLAGWVCKVAATLIRFPLITLVPLRALCHHYWLSCFVYEVLWHVWVFHSLYANGWMPLVIIYVGCSRPVHIFQLLNKCFRL